MLISLNWLRDFVDIPRDVDAHRLSQQFTLACAEVEGVEPIRPGAHGLIAATVVEVKPISGNQTLRHAKLDIGQGRTAETVTSATMIAPGQTLLYAPIGAKLGPLGTMTETKVGGLSSAGMIVSADTVGITLGAGDPVLLPSGTQAGHAFPSTDFEDWVIEVDNKAITHRPDLWGHFGLAREFAAMLELPLKPYPVAALTEIQRSELPPIPIEIDDPAACPRYTGLVMRGVTSQPAPLWMQLRLGHIGMRPIDALVDLTNYVMAELGQPLHAFDSQNVDRIEVGWAASGSKFTTLDGVERTLADRSLLIMSHRKPVALAGVMGGLASEVSRQTDSILLESANFAPAVIRRCATALGLRTEASARFEKSLDHHNTLLAVQRFYKLAKEQFAGLQVASALSDVWPAPPNPIHLRLHPDAVSRFMGHPMTGDRITKILSALEFKVTEQADHSLDVVVPSFRATKDISIPVDLIEEVARCVGYAQITPSLPEVTVRYFEPNAQRALENSTLRYHSEAAGFCEIFSYIWDDQEWNEQLGYQPEERLELRNPAAAGLQYLRKSLLPSLLRAADRNRHFTDEFKLLEVGSVFPNQKDCLQQRDLGLLLGRKQKKAEDALLAELKGVVELWCLNVLGHPPLWGAAEAQEPWAQAGRSSALLVGGLQLGRLSLVPMTLRRKIDDHLAAWSLAWAEINLTEALQLKSHVEKLPSIPAYPEVQLDFSFLVPAQRRYQEVIGQLSAFHDLRLKRISFVGAYEGKGVDPGQRSLTFRILLGDAERTLGEADLAGFRTAFEGYLTTLEYALRK